MHSRPSVKHVLGVLEWFCMLSEKNTFSKKQYGFFTTLAAPPSPGLAKDHKKYVFFFRTPSLTSSNNECLGMFKKQEKFHPHDQTDPLKECQMHVIFEKKCIMQPCSWHPQLLYQSLKSMKSRRIEGVEKKYESWQYQPSWRLSLLSNKGREAWLARSSRLSKVEMGRWKAVKS